MLLKAFAMATLSMWLELVRYGYASFLVWCMRVEEIGKNLPESKMKR
jgi:hypothetical protein